MSIEACLLHYTKLKATFNTDLGVLGSFSRHKQWVQVAVIKSNPAYFSDPSTRRRIPVWRHFHAIPQFRDQTLTRQGRRRWQEQEIRSSGETGGWGMWQITAFDPNDAAFRCLKHSAAITWGKRRRCWFLFEGTMPPETGALDQ